MRSRGLARSIRNRIEVTKLNNELNQVGRHILDQVSFACDFEDRKESKKGWNQVMFVP